jgi:hypothetical protein
VNSRKTTSIYSTVGMTASVMMRRNKRCPIPEMVIIVKRWGILVAR